MLPMVFELHVHEEEEEEERRKKKEERRITKSEFSSFLSQLLSEIAELLGHF